MAHSCTRTALDLHLSRAYGLGQYRWRRDGKMIPTPSVVVARPATQSHGQEGPLLCFVFPHGLALAAPFGICVSLLARPALLARLIA